MIVKGRNWAKSLGKDLLCTKMWTKGYLEFNQGEIEIICWSNDKTVSGLDYLSICQWRADQLFAKAEGWGKYWSVLHRQITESIVPAILTVLSTTTTKTDVSLWNASNVFSPNTNSGPNYAEEFQNALVTGIFKFVCKKNRPDGLAELKLRFKISTAYAVWKRPYLEATVLEERTYYYE